MLLIIIMILLDQVVKFTIIKSLYNSSKVIIEGVLNLTYVENRGGAFGIGSGRLITFIIVNIIVIALIGKFIILKKDDIATYILISGGLIIAGGIGNLIDRIFRGFVIDYIDINPLFKYPMFNIADICIVAGCITIAINVIINTIKERKENK